MEFRKLNRREHGRTRELYEAAFPEDGRAFTDYYYEWKTRDNEIFAALDGKKICGMVHLNPVIIWREGELEKLHYIVAVATRKEYRHRGVMRRLLSLSEDWMKEQGETFTFLMPVKEEIYRPFGYRFFCCQRQGTIQGRKREGLSLSCRPVKEENYGELSGFVNEVLKESYRAFVWRDTEYYTRMAREQACQGGSVWGIYEAERLLGSFCTEKTGEKSSPVEIREIICRREEAKGVREALEDFVSGQGVCRVRGCVPDVALTEERRKPLYMGKTPGGGISEVSAAELGEDWFVNEVV